MAGDGSLTEIPLANGRGVALVDDADAPLVQQYKWSASPNGRTVYAHTSMYHPKRTVSMHRFLCPDAPRVDHRDGNGLNNQRANLRPCTNAQNMRNTAPYQGRRFKGVGWERRRGRWRAYIEEYGRQTFLGRYDTAEEAALAYNTEALRRWGEFARLNDVEGLPTERASAA